MPQPSPRIRYDAVGNIILLDGGEHQPHRAFRSASALSLPWPTLHTFFRAIFSESALQYRWTFSTFRGITHHMHASAVQRTSALLAFLHQPVWIPGRRGIPKQYNRGTLFLLDSLRFGTTFAVIFALLFFTLNYQSFEKIAAAMMDPLALLNDRLPVEQATETLFQKPLGHGDTDLAQFLPPIGPPENRLLIPSLGVNVPIVIPPNDALLKEDWDNLEKDIQTSLEKGTVHYPGTARPGQAGNFFVTGHSSYYPWSSGKYKSVFARLPSLNIGEEFWVYYGGDRHRYVVQEKKEVKSTDVGVLDQPLDRRIATLMTCVPVGTTLRRLIVTAQELDPITGSPMAVGQHAATTDTPKIPSGMLPI
ncbi:sortase [Candidatus Peregrinibacteria bacterium]|nr:sortase [Candidatus Peregrinibacteria bacterium]